MKTTHLVIVPVEVTRESTAGLAALGLGSFNVADEETVEILLTARVSLVKGTRDELEIEWVGESATRFDDLMDNEQEGATEQAEALWWDAMRDEPSELEERIDHELMRWKEERYAS